MYLPAWWCGISVRNLPQLGFLVGRAGVADARPIEHDRVFDHGEWSAGPAQSESRLQCPLVRKYYRMALPGPFHNERQRLYPHCEDRSLEYADKSRSTERN